MKSLLELHLTVDDKMAKNARPVKVRFDSGTRRFASLFADSSIHVPTTRTSKRSSEE